VVKALSELGVKAEANGRNDITIDSRKVSGSAQRIYKNRILHHGTLLFNSDISKMSGVLNVRPEKFISKSTKSVSSRVGNISDYLTEKITLAEFWDRLAEAFAKDVPFAKEKSFAIYELTNEDISAVNALAENYAKPEWTFRTVQPMDIAASKKFDGGFLDIHLKVSNCKITNCRIFGDFMAVKDIGSLEAALIDAEFSPSGIRTVLAGFPLRGYLGNITTDQFIECIFE
ncbi:MAG: lipoate--protein ligase, partial [Clostridiales bacterium]|nr:lipoate--protein ligase [Clostridiales bacterium]